MLVELVVAGRHARGADALLGRYTASTRLTLVSAAHGLVEAVSALRRLNRRGALSADESVLAVDKLVRLDLTLDAPNPRLRDIWSLRDRMSAYDAAYAAAARALEVPLITVDLRLLRACRDAEILALSLDDLVDAPS